MLEQNQIQCFRKRSTVPKYLLQGDLFPASKNISQSSGERYIRTFGSNELLVSHQGFTQFDLAISLAYKKIINANKNFENVRFSLANFAQALNRLDGGKTRRHILDAFERSNRFHLSFQFGSNQFDGFRLSEFSEEKTNFFSVSFNMDYLTVVYDEQDTCDIDIDLFLSLPLGLQSWFYGFICASPNMDTVTVDALHKYSGSNYKNQSDFKKAIKAALQALYRKKVIEWRYGIDRQGNVFWKYQNPF